MPGTVGKEGSHQARLVRLSSDGALDTNLLVLLVPGCVFYPD